MNWGELKQEIRDLGFEEDSTMEEYASIVKNASNRAIDMVYHELVMANKEYLGALYSAKKKIVDKNTGEVTYERIKWQPPTEVDHITDDTTDDFEIDLPERVIYILPVLASYYIWLDDDQVKAVMYWNQYDTMKNELAEEARSRNYNCDFYGGLWF